MKIEGEKRKKRRSSSSGSDDSSSSSNSLPAFTATTRLTLSERFGKMAQWSVDRSNMENMRITKDSAGGALKVMIEEGLESPPARNYSPAPPGHFPEELAMTAPTGLMSWDDVRVRYEYYKSRGYLRDLDLQVSANFSAGSRRKDLITLFFSVRRITSSGRNGGIATKNG